MMQIPIAVESAHNALASTVDMYAKALLAYQQNLDALAGQNARLSEQCAELTKQRDGLLKQLNDVVMQVARERADNAGSPGHE